MSPDQFLHEPGVWWHGNDNPSDVNRAWNKRMQHSGTHLGSLEAASETAGTQSMSLSMSRATDRSTYLHPVRLPEGTLPITTKSILKKEHADPIEGTTEGGTLWKDQGDAPEWEMALEVTNADIPIGDTGGVGVDESSFWKKGLIYRNDYEDKGSISAVVPHHTTQTVSDWIEQGMREHPERVHPALRHWAESGGGTVPYDRKSHQAARQDKPETEMKGQVGFAFSDYDGAIIKTQEKVSKGPPVGDPLHDSVVRSTRDRHR